MSHQQPPDERYQQQPWPAYGAPQGQQPYYEQPQQPYYGRGDLQPAQQQYQPGYSPGQRSYPPQAAHPGHRQAAGKQYSLRGAEVFWYVLGCISFGVAYFWKLPAKKAACEVFSELQLDGQGPSRSYCLHGMEGFWYALMCLWFGAGYFAKVSAKKALWEAVGVVQAAPGHAEAIGRALSGGGPSMPYRPGPGY